MNAYLIIGNNCDLKQFNFNNSLVIGIDRGAYLASINKIKLNYAIGDFDSVDEKELAQIKADKIIKLNPIKDDTDTLAALKLCQNCEKIYLLGGITGKRCEHFLANLMLFNKYPNLIIIDNNSIISLCDYEMDLKKDEYKYYSFFAFEEVFGLSLKGFKYDLNNYHLALYDTLGISNEVIDDALLSFQKGKLLLIKTKEEGRICNEKK